MGQPGFLQAQGQLVGVGRVVTSLGFHTLQVLLLSSIHVQGRNLAHCSPLNTQDQEERL